MRNVPRCGAPVASLKTPYAFAAAPCGQKSDAKVYSAPSCSFHAWRAADGIARDEDDLRAGVAERLEVLLEVARLVLAHGREREGVEDEEDVRAAAEVREPHALAVGDRQVELGCRVTCLHRHPPAPLPLRKTNPRAGFRSRKNP